MDFNLKDSTSSFDPADIQNNSTMAGLSYLLFFLPLITCPESSFAKFHANQSLVLLLVSILGNIVFRIIPFIGWFFALIFCVLVFILWILGIINAFQGKAISLPVVGSFTIFK